MICEMEVVSDSSCDSVIISGPIPDYPELRRRKTNSGTPQRNRRRKENDDQDDITLDEKVEKIQELEDLVNATASLPVGSDHRGDGDAGNWSGSDTKSVKGGKSRHSAGKYLKKIKTLQQNKRRQETRIARLTKEVRSLRDKNSVQAAYIDVLCGMLGEDMKEKFRDRQGLGILGNVKADDEDRIGGEDGNEDGTGAWCPEEGENGARNHGEESEMQAKEREFYCVEELDNLPSTSCSGVARNGSVEDLPGTAMGDGTEEHDENKVATDKEVFLVNNGLQNGHVDSMEDEEICVEKPEGVATYKEVFLINNGLENEHVESMEDEKTGVEKPEGDDARGDGTNAGVEDQMAEEPHDYGSAQGNKVPAVEYKDAEVVCHDAVPLTENECHDYDSGPVTENGCHQYDTVPEREKASNEYDRVPETENSCREDDTVPETENASHEYDAVPVTENACHQYVTVPEIENHNKGFSESPESPNEQEVPEYQSLFHNSESENHPLPVMDIPKTANPHLNLQELLENGNHFLNFRDGTRSENGLIQDPGTEELGHEMNRCIDPDSSTNEDVEMGNVPYDQQQTSSGLC